uniref:ATP synthase subunit f, mitochondrial n=1 Tax=Otus sunia TaxID=257818 RepID=A0A8C8E6W1_9STRI
MDTNLLDVKLGHLPPWLAARHFSLCLHGALCRCYDRYYSKLTSLGEWGLGGIAMELAGKFVIKLLMLKHVLLF